jgi:hypothetical protein
MIRIVLALILPVLVAVGGYLLQAAKGLGAHPIWADQIVIIGLAVGAAFGLLLAMSSVGLLLRMAGPAVLAVGAYFLSHVGKTRFAASYGDDALAGQLWHYGALAACVFLFAALTALGATRTEH